MRKLKTCRPQSLLLEGFGPFSDTCVFITWSDAGTFCRHVRKGLGAFCFFRLLLSLSRKHKENFKARGARTPAETLNLPERFKTQPPGDLGGWHSAIIPARPREATEFVLGFRSETPQEPSLAQAAKQTSFNSSG